MRCNPSGQAIWGRLSLGCRSACVRACERENDEQERGHAAGCARHGQSRPKPRAVVKAVSRPSPQSLPFLNVQNTSGPGENGPWRCVTNARRNQQRVAHNGQYYAGIVLVLHRAMRARGAAVGGNRREQNPMRCESPGKAFGRVRGSGAKITSHTHAATTRLVQTFRGKTHAATNCAPADSCNTTRKIRNCALAKRP